MNNHANMGHAGTIVSLFGSLLTWFIENPELSIKVVLGVLSLITGVFAIYHYYMGIREKKESIKKIKKEIEILSKKN